MSEKEDRDMSRCSDLIKKTIPSSRLRRLWILLTSDRYKI